jgi:hypothetical protein
MDLLDNEERLELALIECDESDSPNYAALADFYKVNQSTLSRRARGITVSRKDATSIYHKLLTDAQEETILLDIESLSKKGIYITPRILQNTIERLVGHSISKAWPYRFRRRHSDRVKSLYLQGFDLDRQVADNLDHITEFYNRVR